MHSTADKTAYVPGEIARVTCEANNTSGQNVTAIRATLRRHVRVTTPGGGTRNDVATISTIEVPVSCPPGSNASAVLELPIPQGAQHTTNLALLACRFEVASIAVTDGCFVSNATALLPVKYVTDDRYYQPSAYTMTNMRTASTCRRSRRFLTSGRLHSHQDSPRSTTQQ